VITDKTKSTVLTADGEVGTSGKAGYIHAITINGNGAAAGTAQLYNGTDNSGDLRWTITCLATAGDSRSISGLNIWCPDGAYLDLTTCTSVSIEYSGCT